MSNRNLLSLELTTPIDDERPVFIAGNFSEWNPDVADFEMQRVRWQILFCFLSNEK